MENVSVNITEIVEVVNIDVTEGLRGEKGEQGIQGIKGDTGEQGIQGIQGIQGEKGEDGNTILNNSLKIKESELFVDGKKLAFEEDITFAGVLEENVILLQSNWTLVNGFWEYDYANALIKETSIVDIVPYKETIDYVKFADIMPMAISGVGTVKIYATNQPIGDINVLIKIV